MKSQLLIFVIVSFLALAYGFPGATRDREELDTPDDKLNVDTVLIIPTFDSGFRRPMFSFINTGDDDDGDDDDVGMSFNPFRVGFRPIQNPFTALIDSFLNTMKRLNDHVPSSLPSYPFDKIPEGANTTSNTTIINGRVVTINETTFGDNNPNLTYFFHVRTIDVKPENSTDILTGIEDDNADNNGGEQMEKETTPANKSSDNATERSVETVEDSKNNEIPDNQVETLKA